MRWRAHLRILQGLLGLLLSAADTLEARDAEGRLNPEAAVVVLDAERPTKVRSVGLFNQMAQHGQGGNSGRPLNYRDVHIWPRKQVSGQTNDEVEFALTRVSDEHQVGPGRLRAQTGD